MTRSEGHIPLNIRRVQYLYLELVPLLSRRYIQREVSK